LKEFSEVTVRQIRSIVNAYSGKLQTSAHVQIDDRTIGEQIIAKLNNTEVEGALIGVKESKR
jgi:transcriptional regulator NrdR family protein